MTDSKRDRQPLDLSYSPTSPQELASWIRWWRKNPPKVREAYPVFLTGYSDASWEESSKKGGWSAWVRDSFTRVIRAGPCPSYTATNVEAELGAVWAAVYTALSELDHHSADILVVKTDCQGVASWFGYRGSTSMPKRLESKRLVFKCFQMAAERHIQLIVKWVKGHQGTGSAEGFLNDAVDKLSRKARIHGTRFRHSEPVIGASTFNWDVARRQLSKGKKKS